MSDPIPPPESEEDVVDDDVTLEDVIRAFLRTFPTPTDEQLHFFSESLGIPYETFEEHVFKMFGEALESEDFEELMDEDGDFADDDLDLFLVAFFTFVPNPSEDTVHKIATLIEVTPEELEQRVYRMLSTLLNETSEDDSVLDGDELEDSDDADEGDVFADDETDDSDDEDSGDDASEDDK